MSTARRLWTSAELELLRCEYPNRTCAEVSRLVGHSPSSTYQYAARLGLKKSDAFNASAASGRLSRDDARGRSGRFKSGHPSWNKGTHWIAGGRSAQTRFKKGRPVEQAHNHKPIGSLRVTRSGVLERKVSDDRAIVPARRWVAVSRLVWESVNGPIPDGHSIVFKPGMHSVVAEEIRVERLELLSRAELMARNTLHRYPKEIAYAIQLRGALMRQINKRNKKREDEDQRSA